MCQLIDCIYNKPTHAYVLNDKLLPKDSIENNITLKMKDLLWLAYKKRLNYKMSYNISIYFKIWPVFLMRLDMD